MKAKLILVWVQISIAGIISAQTCGPSPISKYSQAVDRTDIRTVAGKTYNIRQSPLWFSDLGGVVAQQDGIVIVDCLLTHNLTAAVTNYSGDVVATKPIELVAMRIGTYDYAGTPLELWDCGTPYVAPPPTAEQIKTAQEISKARAIEDKKRIAAAQIAAVQWLLPQATNGSAVAQCSLGLRYLNGQGCETNREQAIYWLTQSANQGNLEASNKLVSLK